MFQLIKSIKFHINDIATNFKHISLLFWFLWQTLLLVTSLKYPHMLPFRLGLSQDVDTRCPKLAILKFWGVLFFKGDQNILGSQTSIYLVKEGIISLYTMSWELYRGEKENEIYA